jgi:hypothetical protein
MMDTAAPYCQRFNHDARTDPELDQSSIIDPALIEGLDGAQRKPFVKAYWGRAGFTPAARRERRYLCGICGARAAVPRSNGNLAQWRRYLRTRQMARDALLAPTGARYRKRETDEGVQSVSTRAAHADLRCI